MSPVLDTFVAAVAAADPDRAEPLERELEATLPHDDERENTIRCLSAARRAMHRATGDERDGEPITDSEVAFVASEWARPIRLDRPRERVQANFLAAMELASDRLGPIPGGRKGSAKDPVRAPAVVEDVKPTHAELIEMSAHAGTAVGAAGALGLIDPLAELRRVLAA